MCGILGFNGKKKDVLSNMLKSLNHRGPDDIGRFETEKMSLGHTRLAIMDLSNHGHQPMRYKNLRMVYNGEVYNFREIRGELLKLGYEFTSETDSEVILKAYYEWGIKAVDKFIGMFAIAIYNTRSADLVLIRDRVGIKPIYYYFDDELFVFASELKPIMDCNPSLSICKEGLNEFLQFGYISSNLSIFENTHKVPPGNFLTFNAKTHKIKIETYWSILPFFALPKFKKSETELIDELEHLLIDACKYRMVSDVPVGVFLSGGIDSSVVAAILQKHHGNIHTFTIGFKEARYNEADHAKAIAEYIGSNHTEKYLSSEEAKKIFDHFVDIYDEPFGDSSGIPTTLVSQLAKDSGVKVVLSADGGDEIFCGYDRYWYAHKIGTQLFKLPYFLRKNMGRTLEKLGYHPIFNKIPIRNFEHKFHQIAFMFQDENWKSLYEKIVQNTNTHDIKSLLGETKEVDFNGFSVGEKEHPMQGMMLWDYHRYLVDDILTKVDRATMSVSIEGREPLLDHRIAEFMAQVPFEYKYRKGTSKYLLKKVLERYIPRTLTERPKKGFGIPMLEWFGGDLRFLFDRHFKKERIEKHGLYAFDYLMKEYLSFKEGKTRNINKIWLNLVFEMWHERYMEN